jgi:hypothetical protein
VPVPAPPVAWIFLLGVGLLLYRDQQWRRASLRQ